MVNHYIQYQQTQQPPLTSNHWTITSNINKPNNPLLPQITEPLHPISTNPTTTSYLKSLNHYIQYQQTQQPPLTSNHWTITSNINKPNNHLLPQITEQSKNDSLYEILQTTRKFAMVTRHCFWVLFFWHIENNFTISPFLKEGGYKIILTPPLHWSTRR
jgi:hypothetical protein